MGKMFEGRKKILTIPPVVLLGLFFLPITLLLSFGWLIRSKVHNKTMRIIGFSVVGFFLLIFSASYIVAFVNPSKTSTKVENVVTKKPVVEGVNTEVSPTSEIRLDLVKVIRVIDGDTIEIEGGQKVRYIGIDTPETYDCYYSESLNKNKDLVEGKMVSLIKDISETDRYGRLLRYVYIDGVFVNEQLVKEGYANASTYPPDVKFKDNFITLESEARSNNRGLWSSCKASPKPSQTISNQAQGSTSRPTTKSTKTPTSATVNTGASTYPCDCSKTCPNMSSCIEAQYQLNTCGCTARDTDHDGIACDSQCQ